MKSLQWSWRKVLQAAVLAFSVGVSLLSAQQLDSASVARGIDAAVQARIDHVAEYTVIEHYAVYRNGDESHAAAERSVRTVYSKDHGKSYTILTESGSALLRSQILDSILENEKRMSQPGTRETVLVTSANYQMTLKSPATQSLDGHDCLLLALTPKRNSPSLFQGTLWVDAKDFSIVQLEGTATKSHSILTGPAQVSRQYASMSGFPMATHARAVSKSALLGQTTVKIDYENYQVKLAAGK